jgi:hypothetical protein
MVHNYILVYVRNCLWILGKQNVVIFNIASIHLPDKEIDNALGPKFFPGPLRYFFWMRTNDGKTRNQTFANNWKAKL